MSDTTQTETLICPACGKEFIKPIYELPCSICDECWELEQILMRCQKGDGDE